MEMVHVCTDAIHKMAFDLFEKNTWLNPKLLAGKTLETHESTIYFSSL